MTPQEKDLFTAHFGYLCHILFKPEQTLSEMFIEGETATGLFERLSRNLDEIGKVVYKEQWEDLKTHILK